MIEAGKSVSDYIEHDSYSKGYIKKKKFPFFFTHVAQENRFNLHLYNVGRILKTIQK